MKTVWIEDRQDYSVRHGLKSLFRDIYVTLQDLEFHTNNFNVFPLCSLSWPLTSSRAGLSLLIEALSFSTVRLGYGRGYQLPSVQIGFLCMVFPWTPLVHQPGPDPSREPVSSQPVHSLIKVWGSWGTGEDVLASAGCIPESSCAPEGMGGASAWVTRGGCHGGNCRNTDASIGSVLLAGRWWGAQESGLALPYVFRWAVFGKNIWWVTHDWYIMIGQEKKSYATWPSSDAWNGAARLWAFHSLTPVPTCLLLPL